MALKSRECLFEQKRPPDGLVLRVIDFMDRPWIPKTRKSEGQEVWTKKGGNPNKLRLGGNGLGSVKNGFAWLCLDRKFRSGQFGKVFGPKKPEKKQKLEIRIFCGKGGPNHLPLS